MPTTKKMSLAAWIFIGLAAGILTGLFFLNNPAFPETYIRPFGTLFLNLIKFIIVPIVLFSIISGVISMGDIRKVGSVGWKTVAFYLFTTAFAVMIGLFVANAMKGTFLLLETSELSYEAAAAPGLIETILNIFPSNALEPLLNATMLQVIVIAIFIGFGIILAGEKGKTAAAVADSFSEVFMQIMMFIIKLSPLGVFCLIVPVVAANGPGVLGSLAMVLATAYLCFILHTAIVYSLVLKFLGGISPLRFFKTMAPAMILGFSSASSVGALPLNMECCEKLGGKKEIVRFILPLGATINMDGTAIYQGVCSIFIAASYGIELTLSQLLTIIITATLASIGTAGVPGAGMIMLAMVLESVGLPVAGIALVAGVDRIFDMGRTTVNITGDAACSLIVSRMEEKRTGSTG